MADARVKSLISSGMTVTYPAAIRVKWEVVDNDSPDADPLASRNEVYLPVSNEAEADAAVSKLLLLRVNMSRSNVETVRSSKNLLESPSPAEYAELRRVRSMLHEACREAKLMRENTNPSMQNPQLNRPPPKGQDFGANRHMSMLTNRSFETLSASKYHVETQLDSIRQRFAIPPSPRRLMQRRQLQTLDARVTKLNSRTFSWGTAPVSRNSLKGAALTLPNLKETKNSFFTTKDLVKESAGTVRLDEKDLGVSRNQNKVAEELDKIKQLYMMQ